MLYKNERWISIVRNKYTYHRQERTLNYNSEKYVHMRYTRTNCDLQQWEISTNMIYKNERWITTVRNKYTYDIQERTLNYNSEK